MVWPQGSGPSVTEVEGGPNTRDTPRDSTPELTCLLSRTHALQGKFRFQINKGATTWHGVFYQEALDTITTIIPISCLNHLEPGISD